MEGGKKVAGLTGQIVFSEGVHGTFMNRLRAKREKKQGSRGKELWKKMSNTRACKGA